MSTAVQNVRTRHEWAEIINADWREAVNSIIHVGIDLVTAQEELGGPAFNEMIERDLPFSRNVASRLMTIARDPKIADMTSEVALPPSWRVLSELRKLSAEDFADAAKKGLVSEKTSLRAASGIVGAYKTPEGESWGENYKPDTLPKPSEARNIARETGRMVAASDGNLYSGTTEEEDEGYLRRREQTYGVMDAIKTLADVGVSPSHWLDQVKPHWLNRFDVGDLDRASAWLQQLRADYFRREKIVDGNGNGN